MLPDSITTDRQKFRFFEGMKKWLLKYWKRVLVIAVVVGAGFVFWADYHVASFSKAYCTTEIDALPRTHVALVLGTSSKLTNGNPNHYFDYRIDAATDLYESGKVERIIVSGDNRTIYYNEPQQMTRALIASGVPEDRIHSDYAGLRTFDSMVRAQEVFGQDSVIVVSQSFHNERAVYIARHHGIQAWGFNARDVNASMGFKTRVREYFARCKMLLDLYVLNTEPRHLGEPVEIPAD